MTGLDALGVPPGLGEVYELALTHRSFAFEQPDPLPHNERLEFLGDAVLGAVVAELIYTRFPGLDEGGMARLRAAVVNTRALADLADELGVGDHIRLGKGEEASGGRSKPSLLANTLEALVGAVFLERGVDVVQERLGALFADRLRRAVTGGAVYDPKTTLQEAVVREHGSPPAYRVAASGPDHDRRFEATVYVDGEPLATGAGSSKKDAEQNAAREALARLAVAPAALGELDEAEKDARAS